MKVTVTHLKAPWPAGTVPGHVVELAGVESVPGWALGKCTPAADDAEAVSTWTPPGAPVFVVNPVSEGEAVEAAPVAGSGDDAAPAKRKAKATG